MSFSTAGSVAPKRPVSSVRSSTASPLIRSSGPAARPARPDPVSYVSPPAPSQRSGDNMHWIRITIGVVVRLLVLLGRLDRRLQLLETGVADLSAAVALVRFVPRLWLDGRMTGHQGAMRVGEFRVKGQTGRGGLRVVAGGVWEQGYVRFRCREAEELRGSDGCRGNRTVAGGGLLVGGQ